MERALKTIVQMRMSQDTDAREKLACRAWGVTMGKKITAHARAVKLVRGRLVVEVEDATWQRQLFTLRQQIIARIGDHLGAAIVEEVEFRIGIPRMQPQREERGAVTQVGLFADEADGIRDPVMRRLYQQSRRKALA